MATIYTQAISVTTACGTIAVMRTSRERKAIWGQSAQTTTRVVGVCIIAKGHPHQLHRVLKNTEVKERNSTIYRHVFRCSTAHQCSLVQSGYGTATIYTQVIVSDNPLVGQ